MYGIIYYTRRGLKPVLSSNGNMLRIDTIKEADSIALSIEKARHKKLFDYCRVISLDSVNE